jgi:hypothetical protein
MTPTRAPSRRRARFLPARLAALALALAAFPGAAAPTLAQSAYENPVHGFSFRAPEDWKGVPPPPGQKLVVVRFQSEKAFQGRTARVLHNPQLDVLVFPTAEKQKGEVKASNKKLLGSLGFTGKSKDFKGWMEGRFPDAEQKRSPKKLKISKIPALAYEFTTSKGSTVPMRVKAYAFQIEDAEVALVYTVMDEWADKIERDLERSARTFKTIEKREDSVSEQGNLSDQEWRIRQKIDALPPGWNHMRSPKDRYVLFYNVEDSFAKQLGKQLEAMRDFYETLFPPDEPITDISAVRICDTREVYRAYGGPDGSGGYWSSNDEELVIFNNQDEGTRYVEAVVNHEAFHQYIYYFYGELAPHSWYNEGHGDYFSGAKLNRALTRVLDIGKFDWRTDTVNELMRTGTWVPLRKFLDMSKEDYYRKGTENYAQGWSVIYFLRSGRREGGAVDSEWIEMLDTYLDNLVAARDDMLAEKKLEKLSFPQQEDCQHKAYELTFADWNDEDWERFQAAWVSFYD